ncbi:hypothetical protein CEE37_14900 [candidate division LCP-89 bacterium B3_LCP]|uniref:Uncharacterized protein n=1 Tax=candidate division LCP-89 bacterium B3_LCP TaxID=2012998 RepID=A0A532UNR8_UNCL8|nr:MAG: hypothetical protein CEE37_14900 [candidate division LCP-89 bacterium B3_LCP]
MKQCIDAELGRLIALYELGQLSDDERDRFEEHLLKCDFCLGEIEEKMPVISAFQEHKDEIREELKRESIEYKPQKRKLLKLVREERKRKALTATIWERIISSIEDFRRAKVFVPATIVTIALVVFLIMRPGTQPENPYFAHLSFEKAPFKQMHVRSDIGTDAQLTFRKGMDEYLKGNFKGAIDYLENAVSASPDEGPWWLYLGISYYLDRQAKPAVKALTKAVSLTEYTLKSGAEWYLAQAFLLDGNADPAMPLLEGLAIQKRDYSEIAESLLEKVRPVAEKEK